jgi:chromosome segregation ATPase
MDTPQEQPPKVSMREYLERVIDERDRQYDMRFRAAEIAVSAALSAQEKAVAAAFLASEKAIIKAEEAQKDYNSRSNEFRGQLDDQAKLLMSRAESLGLFRANDDKLETMRLTFDSKIESQRISFEKSLDGLNKEIASLRESRSEVTGKDTGMSNLWGYLAGAAGLAVAVISLLTR